MSDEQQAHREKMKALQKAQREKRAQTHDPGRGLVLMLTGDGKGKSSSAFGMVARAIGWGHRVAVVQFIKGKWKTGERQFFQRLGDDAVTWYTMGEGFTWDTQDRARDVAAASAAWEHAQTLMRGGDYDLVVLDEINIVLRYDYLASHDVREGLEQRHQRTSVVLTGRDGPAELCEYADLVSEVRAIKHPFEAGIRAQRGIDF